MNYINVLKLVGDESIKDDSHTGHPLTSKTNENVERIKFSPNRDITQIQRYIVYEIGISKKK